MMALASDTPNVQEIYYTELGLENAHLGYLSFCRSHYIIILYLSFIMRWAVNVARMGEKLSACRCF
jgi:hypothetical protein